MAVRTFIFPTPLEEIELQGTDATIVRFNDSGDPSSYGVKHRCAEWDDDQEPDGRFIKVVAPRLSDHNIARNGDLITVSPSIACRDCGLHGFIKNNQWKDA